MISALEITCNDPNVIIYTDSQYTMKGLLNWMPRWKNNNWKKADGGVILNLDLWQKMDSLYFGRKVGTVIKFCKAHSGIFGNEMADALSKAGAESYQY